MSTSEVFVLVDGGNWSSFLTCRCALLRTVHTAATYIHTFIFGVSHLLTL